MLGGKAARGAATEGGSTVLGTAVIWSARGITERTVRMWRHGTISGAISRATTVVVRLTGVVVNVLRFHKVAQTTVCVRIVIQGIAGSVKGLLPLVQANIVEGIFAIGVIVHDAVPVRARQNVRKYVDLIQSSGQMIDVHVKGLFRYLEVIGLKFGRVAGEKRTSERPKMAIPVGVGPVSISDVVAYVVPGGAKTAAQDTGQLGVTCAVVNVKAVSGTSLGELVENTEDAFGVRGIRGKDKILLPAMLGTRGMSVGVGKRDCAVVLKENVGVKEDGRGL